MYLENNYIFHGSSCFIVDKLYNVHYDVHSLCIYSKLCNKCIQGVRLMLYFVQNQGQVEMYMVLCGWGWLGGFAQGAIRARIITDFMNLLYLYMQY